MDVDAYLRRLDYSGSTEPTLVVLSALHRAHLVHVPFENLSIHTGESIELSEAWLFDKIVHRRRGGFCYELNGLFAGLLRELGFVVHMHEARVFNAEGEPGIRFDHLALSVDLGGEDAYLADVGFGDSLVEPLRFHIGETSTQGRAGFTLYRDGVATKLMRRDSRTDSWKPQFRIENGIHELADFTPGCEYHQTSPDSSFTSGRICSRLTAEGGRFTLRDRRWIETAPGGERIERELDSEQDVARVLKERFAIELG